MIDVADAGDCVVKSAPRQLVHAEKYHNTVRYTYLFSRCRSVVFAKARDTASALNKWVSSCSGHVDAGEGYLQAAQRELGEEIGLQLSCDALQAIFKQSPCPATGGEFVWVYTCQSEGPFILDPEEVSDGQWIDRADLADWLAQAPRDFAWSFVHLWEQYCARTAIAK